MIWWEDVRVGDEAEMGSVAVTREEVIAFAERYDPQPFHLSDEAAARTHFGRLAASGWHTAAMTMGVVARYVMATEQQGLGSPGVDELRWLKPVHPGDVLNVRSRVLDTTPSRSKPNIGSVRSIVEVKNQDGATVLRWTAIVLMRRRPGNAAA